MGGGMDGSHIQHSTTTGPRHHAQNPFCNLFSHLFERHTLAQERQAWRVLMRNQLGPDLDQQDVCDTNNHLFYLVSDVQG